MLKCTILVTNFQKSPSAGGAFNIGDLKSRDLAKLCVSIWL